IGRDRCWTDPDAVHQLLNVAPGHIRWGTTPSTGIFHPKVYLFHRGDRLTALVGSANLTRGGFTHNTEATIQLSGSASEVKGLMQFLKAEWKRAVPVTAENLAEYETDWRARPQPGVAPCTTPAVATTSCILSWGWDDYVCQLRRADRLWWPY